MRLEGPQSWLRTAQNDYKWLSQPSFVSSFETGGFVYFFFRENAVEYLNCGEVNYVMRKLEILKLNELMKFDENNLLTWNLGRYVDLRPAICGFGLRGTSTVVVISSPAGLHAPFLFSLSTPRKIKIYPRLIALFLYDQRVYPRIGRICKDDPGGSGGLAEKWTTFLKARLDCSVPGGSAAFHYDSLQSIAFLPAEDVFYGLFTTQE